MYKRQAKDYVPELARPGEWITLRGNHARTGKASAVGNMTGASCEAAVIDLGCYETLVRLTGRPKSGGRIPLPAGPAQDTAAKSLER